MVFLKCSVFVLWIVAYIDASKFRCDYTYMRGAEGWFKLHISTETWDAAKSICKVEGAELAWPTNDDVKDAMLSLIFNDPNVLSVYVDILGYKEIHPYHKGDSQYEVSVLPDERMTLNFGGDFVSVRKEMKYPFICFNMKEKKNVTLNECGTTDKAYKLDQRTGSCYKFHNEQLDFYSALETCVIEEGRLAIINSEIEALIIKELFAANPPDSILGWMWRDSAFLGFLSPSEFPDTHAFYTIDGVPLEETGYAEWSTGEPNNAAENENCGSVGRNGRLFDDPCTRRLPFICEKSPERSCEEVKSSMENETY